MKFYSLIIGCIVCLSFADDPTKLVGQPVPSFAVISTDSSVIDVDFFKSKITILTFYSWGCLPCRHEIKVLSKLAIEYSSQDFRLVIVTDDNDKKIRRHFTSDSILSSDKEKFRFNPDNTKIISDRKHSIYRSFKIKPTPATFFIDRKGIIREFLLGFPTNTEHEEIMYHALKEKIQKLELEASDL